MPSTIENNFITALQQLVGKTCWGIAAGAGTGSIVNLSCGDKIKREKPLKNELLSFEERHYDGEYGLMIWCIWRLDAPESIVTGNYDPNDNDGPMVRGLELLRNARIIKVKCFLPAYDLHITFNNNLTLKLFCESINTNGCDENYYFFTPEGVYSVEQRSRLTFEE